MKLRAILSALFIALFAATPVLSAITTVDGLVAAPVQQVSYTKTAARTTVANGWFSMFDLAGNPGAGTLAAGNTTNGVVQDDTLAGCPLLNAFGGGATGYLSSIQFGNTAASRFYLHDRIFAVGAIAFGAGTTTLTSQPSYAARMPGGSYVGTQIWIEVTTAFATGTAWQAQVSYTNQAGTSSRSTVILPATAAAGLTLGRMYQLALQAGDSGVQRIDSVTVTNGGTAMTAGAFNVLVVRPLYTGARVMAGNAGDVHSWDRIGFPRIFDTSCLFPIVASDSTTGGLPDLLITVVNG